MRETRLSGSEGGRFEFNRFSLPLLLSRPFGACVQIKTLPQFWIDEQTASRTNLETRSFTIS